MKGSSGVWISRILIGIWITVLVFFGIFFLVGYFFFHPSPQWLRSITGYDGKNYVLAEGSGFKDNDWIWFILQRSEWPHFTVAQSQEYNYQAPEKVLLSGSSVSYCLDTKTWQLTSPDDCNATLKAEQEIEHSNQ